jgi:PPOX class probable F420-dependent enzyme
MPRGDDIRMSEHEIETYLREGHTMTLVTNGARGHPHAIAMFYDIDADGSILFATYAVSQKVKNIERDPRVTLLIETGRAYDELRGVMIEGRATISSDLDRTVATMIKANATTGSPLPDVASIPEDMKKKMAGKRVLLSVRPQRFVSWDHGKLPRSKTPGALKESLDHAGSPEKP